MRIAHINNIAGIASIIAKEQEKAGHESVVFVNNPFELMQFDGLEVHNKPFSKHPKWKYRIDFKALCGDGKGQFLRSLQSFDLIHIHGPYPWILKLLQVSTKQIKVLHWHGSDLRRRGYYDNHCLVSTPDLLKQAPNGAWIPTPIDLEEIRSVEPFITSNPKVPKVAHYPYYRLKSGEPDYYSKALYNLEKQGKCRIVEIFNRSHEDALKMIAQSDIVAGKILPGIGWFGKMELEAMALGKAVIAHIDSELYDVYKPPVFRTSTETFEKDLDMLINYGEEREHLARQGQAYIKERHDSKKVAAQVLEYYRAEPILL